MQTKRLTSETPCVALSGLAGAAFENDMKLPAFWAMFTGLLEVASVALLYKGLYVRPHLCLLAPRPMRF